jgi:hypothetical protein
MAGAINAVGYSPDVFKANEHAGMFLWQLTTYLRSGFPAVLQVNEPGEADGHAITIVGFRVADDAESTDDIELLTTEHGGIHALGVIRLYAHDDRLGPYARMVLKWKPKKVPRGGSGRRFRAIEERLDRLESDEQHLADDDEIADEGSDDLTDNIDTMPDIAFMPNEKGFEAFERPMEMYAAIVPLYPKIRITARDLQFVSVQVWPVVRALAGPDGRNGVYLEGWFTHAGRYLEGVYDLPLAHDRQVAAVSTLRLSRYVGVLRFNVLGDWLVDVVCDATDIHRPTARWGSVLALIPREEDDLGQLRARLKEMYPHVAVL